MTQLKLNTPELRDASTKFKAEANEMETAVANADTAFAPCRDHISKRVSKSAENWDSLKATFKSSLEALVAAADELLAAAEAFEAADNG